MSGDGRLIRVGSLASGAYNPFAAADVELLASALDDAGLIGPETTIDGRDADIPLQSFFAKRERFREVYRLGALLVHHQIISKDDLQKALSLQKEKPGMKLGEVMRELGLCTVDEIESHLDTQVDIRKNLEDIELFRAKINSLKTRLRTYF